MGQLRQESLLPSQSVGILAHMRSLSMSAKGCADPSTRILWTLAASHQTSQFQRAANSWYRRYKRFPRTVFDHAGRTTFVKTLFFGFVSWGSFSLCSDVYNLPQQNPNFFLAEVVGFKLACESIVVKAKIK